MSKPMIWAFAFLAVVPGAKAEVKVVVELVPDSPAPYSGGESLTVDVWLHSQFASDVLLELIRFDFSDADPGLALDPTFTFDFSALGELLNGYLEFHFPELPVPWTATFWDCWCPKAFLPLPSGGSIHIGSIGVQLPTAAGVYHLDALNADEPDDALGAKLSFHFLSERWRAFTGEITGGAFDFVVGPPVPTLSEWGLAAMASLLLGFGCWTIVRRAHRAKAVCPTDGL